MSSSQKAKGGGAGNGGRGAGLDPRDTPAGGVAMQQPEERNLGEVAALLSEAPAAAEDDTGFAAARSESRRRRWYENRFGLILLPIAVIGIVVLVVFVSSDQKRRHEFACFIEGEIQQCKREGVDRLRKQWALEDNASKPEYGDLVLTYFPQDARVDITQTVCKEKRIPNSDKFTEKDCSQKNAIANKSHELKPNEIVEQLPLLNLPVRERTVKETAEGVPYVAEVQTYSYAIKIAREGYQPREFDFTPETWQRLGPDINMTIAWQGCDLVPLPETMREPFVKARTELYCIEKTAANPEEGAKKADEMLSEVVVRNRFRTVKDFMAVQNELTADKVWWDETWATIQKANCKEVLPEDPDAK